MFFVTLLLSFSAGIRAISNTKNSPCTNACGSSQTAPSELNCIDDGYNTTETGRKMKSCLECESTSTTTNSASTTESDQYWFMFNMKYTLQHCMFDSESRAAVYTSCSPECDSLRGVLKTLWGKAEAPLYRYCELDGGAFPQNADACATCLRTISGAQVLANFMNTMKGACENKPDPFQGQTVNVPRGLFDTTNPDVSLPASSASNQTTPAPTTTPAPASSAASQASTPLPSLSSSGNTGLSTGAVVGIGVAAGIGGISIFAAALAFFWRRRRQQRERKLSSSLPPQYDYGNDKAGPPSELTGSFSEQRVEADDGQPAPSPAELPGAQFHDS